MQNLFDWPSRHSITPTLSYSIRNKFLTKFIPNRTNDHPTTKPEQLGQLVWQLLSQGQQIEDQAQIINLLSGEQLLARTQLNQIPKHSSLSHVHSCLATPSQCYDPNLTMSQWAICASVITPNPSCTSLISLSPLATCLFLFITLHSHFPIVSSHPQSLIPGLCSILFLPLSINSGIMYSSSSVWNHITTYHLHNPVLLFIWTPNLSSSLCLKNRDRTSE